jgi:uncharacterized SAM-binding protein YcdF (DUF218 family)
VTTRQAMPVAMVIVAALMAIFTHAWFLSPESVVPERADAAVVMVGGGGERLEAARWLAHEGVVDDVVVAARDLGEASGFRGICDDSTLAGARLHCLPGGDGDTRSEARALGRYAEEQGWDHVVVVTSTYHLTRSVLLVERCFAGTVDGFAATPPSGPAVWFGQVLHEWAGFMEAQVRRGC